MAGETVGAAGEKVISTPRVAACIIVRDGAETIERLLASISEAFDEIVIVDTGSTDDTRERIAEHFGVKAAGAAWRRGEDPIVLQASARPTRLVFSSFAWIDDFAAARNFAFGLATSEWRGYLDADDTFPRAGEIRGNVARLAVARPEVNCLALPYDYSAGELSQDKFRFVRWADGWEWRGAIHEELHRIGDKPRMISKIVDLVVEHHHTAEHSATSLARNIRICEKAREAAVSRRDGRQIAIMDYYLGLYAAHDAARVLEAFDRLDAAFVGLRESTPNLAIDASVHGARLALTRRDPDLAMAFAGRVAAHFPTSEEAQTILGVTLAERGDHGAAVAAFERARRCPPPPITSARDVVLFDGVANTVAAKSCAAVGDLPAASAALSRISPDLRGHDAVRASYIDALGAITRANGMAALKNFWDVLVQNDEPGKARALLDFAPAFIADAPELAALRRFTNHRLRHLDGGWDAYVECYGTLDAGTYSPKRHDAEFIRSFARAKATREWAEALSKEGPPVYVLSVGPQDGQIERDVLAINERIHLDVADASPLATGAIADLIATFPGRVRHHPMKTHGDWPNRPEDYDAIFFFEVLEHVPHELDALEELRARLSPFGTLFLSTPVAGYWPNGTLTRPKGETLYDWWGHVRAFSPKSLWDMVYDCGFTGRLEATDGGTIFLAKLHGVPPDFTAPPATGRTAAIYVPGTPHPFDPDSIGSTHVGGSEEAVIHLASALARQGVEVTVYTPRRPRNDGVTVHGHAGVLWRDVAEFDFLSDDFDAVFFWRCPDVVARAATTRGLDGRSPAYRRILWLHDAEYGVGPETYVEANEIVVLSQFHAGVLADRDCFAGPFTVLANGIDPAAFKACDPLWPGRDPHRAIYASSPDRGLLTLLAAWPRVRALVPDATLDVYYTWDLLRMVARSDSAADELLKNLEAKIEDLKLHGVTYHGGVDHVTLHAAYAQSGVWSYPTKFEEISCISAMKALASGCTPVVCASGALHETLSGQVIEPIDRLGALGYAEKLAAAMLAAPSDVARRAQATAARERFAWDSIAPRFAELIYRPL